LGIKARLGFCFVLYRKRQKEEEEEEVNKEEEGGGGGGVSGALVLYNKIYCRFFASTLIAKSSTRNIYL